jgi:hypothetical protein
MIDGIRSISLPVPDLASGSAWYREFLETPPYLEDSQAVTFFLNGYLLTLHIGQPQMHGTVAYWSVDNLEAEIDRLLSLDLQPRTEIEVLDQYTRKTSFVDPFGNTVGLVERRDPSELRARSQRSAEKIALRKVRTTLDKLATTKEEDQKLRRVVRMVIAIAIAGIVALVWSIQSGTPTQTPVQFTEKVGAAATSPAF